MSKHRLTKGSVRRSLALTAAGAMVFALTPFQGAVAATGDPTDLEEACTGAPDSTFTDENKFSAEEDFAADCLTADEWGNIVKGFTDGSYGPRIAVTREQMAAFIHRTLVSAGVTMPANAPNAFDDDDTSAFHDEINDLAALDIISGRPDADDVDNDGDTSELIYAPKEDVRRDQMAKFINGAYGQISGAELTDDGTDNFVDDCDASLEDDVNALADAGIVQGLNTGLYGCDESVSRGQMLLFIGRTLDLLVENGELSNPFPPAESTQVNVTPDTAATLNDEAARAYSAAFTNEDGSTYTGRVGIQLVDADAAGNPVYNTPATDVTFESVDGAPSAGTLFTGFAGLDGKVDFVIRDGAVATATDVVPVAWIDSDGDGTYETTGNVAPTEPFGLGGVTNFLAAPPAEAVNSGTLYTSTVSSVDKDNDSFVGSTGGANGSADPATFNYDGNDIFQIGGSNVSMATFEAALSSTDVVSINYKNSGVTDGTSVFNITTDNTAVTPLTVTNPASATKVDSSNFVISGKGEPGYTVDIYADTVTHDNTKQAGEPLVGQGTVGSNGAWSVTVPLQQNAANNFAAFQRAAGSAAVANGTVGTDVPTITEGPDTAPIITSATGTNGTGAAGTYDIGDTITLVFDEDVVVANGDTIEMVDADGTRARVTCGTGGGANAICSGTGTGTITISQQLFPVIVTAGGTPGLQDPAQIVQISFKAESDGEAVDLGNSTDVLVDTF